MKNNGKYGYNNVFTEVNEVGENSWYDNNNVCTEVTSYVKYKKQQQVWYIIETNVLYSERID